MMHSSKDITATSQSVTPYPLRDLRFFRGGWNANSQFCYTDAEMTLLNIIRTKHDLVDPEGKNKSYFLLNQIKSWRDWWVCSKPAHPSAAQFNGDSFTLPSREVKDSKMFPLWNFADDMARRIANWQSLRVKGQEPDVMNDPVMLVFNELRDWFYTELAEKECKIEVLEDITRRQHYVNSLIYLIPSFGADRRHLKDIQKELGTAEQKLLQCVANKELPQLLSDLLRSGLSLENVLKNILHLLLINEEVSDNYTTDNLDNANNECQSSPLCKISQAVRAPLITDKSESALTQHKSVNPFYELVTVDETAESTQVELKLKEFAVNAVRFASFVTPSDKTKYLEAVAAVEALAEVRQTLTDYDNIQINAGTYCFAVTYLDKASTLATNYIDLINRTKLLINSLLVTADNGFHQMLSGADKANKNRVFERNLRSLETNFAKGTTVSAQVTTYCQRTVDSMNKYQLELRKLAANWKSGVARTELLENMHRLDQDMDQLNMYIPAMLRAKPLRITLGKPNSIVESTMQSLAPAAEPAVPEEPPPTVITPLQLTSDDWNIEFDKNTVTAIFIYSAYQDGTVALRLEYHSYLKEIKIDPATKASIYIYSIFNEDTEIATAEFYGYQRFCVSADKQQHNIIKTTGELADFVVDQKRMLNETDICPTLPFAFTTRVLDAASHAAINGVIHGGSKALSKQLTQPGRLRNFLDQCIYMGGVFTWKFGVHYSQLSDAEKTFAATNSIYKTAINAAIETGQLALLNFGINFLGSLLERASEYCTQNDWNKLSSGLHTSSSVVRYGVFAYNTYAGNISSPSDAAKATIVTASALAAGTAAEILTEKTSQLMFR